MLDETRHQCLWKTVDIQLTVTEFLLVKALATRPGMVKSRDQLIDAAYGEKDEASGIRCAQLIAAARAERLSTIDGEAAETQARVEALEEQMEARRKAEEAKTDDDPTDTGAPLPVPPKAN